MRGVSSASSQSRMASVSEMSSSRRSRRASKMATILTFSDMPLGRIREFMLILLSSSTTTTSAFPSPKLIGGEGRDHISSSVSYSFMFRSSFRAMIAALIPASAR